MFVVELAFGDDPERLAARPAHRQLLQRLHEQGVVRMAGPLADDAGALLVFDVPDRDALQRLLDADPYVGLSDVRIVRTVEWTPFLT